MGSVIITSWGRGGKLVRKPVFCCRLNQQPYGCISLPPPPGLMPPDFASKPSAPGTLGMFTLPVVRTFAPGNLHPVSHTISDPPHRLHPSRTHAPNFPFNLPIIPVFDPRHMPPRSLQGSTCFCQNPKILPLLPPRIPPALCSRRWPPSCLGTPGASPEGVWKVWTRRRPGSPVAASSRRWRWRCLPARAPIPILLACPRCAM